MKAVPSQKAKLPPIQICMQFAVIVVADSEHSSSFSESVSSFISTAIIQIKMRKIMFDKSLEKYYL